LPNHYTMIVDVRFTPADLAKPSAFLIIIPLIIVSYPAAPGHIFRQKITFLPHVFPAETTFARKMVLRFSRIRCIM